MSKGQWVSKIWRFFASAFLGYEIGTANKETTHITVDAPQSATPVDQTTNLSTTEAIFYTLIVTLLIVCVAMLFAVFCKKRNKNTTTLNI